MPPHAEAAQNALEQPLMRFSAPVGGVGKILQDFSQTTPRRSPPRRCAFRGLIYGE